MTKIRNILVQDLRAGDKIRIPSPEVRITSIAPLKGRYATKMRGKVLEVESVDLLWKGQKTILLLSDDDKVQVAPRPSWGDRMAIWWKARKKKVKAAKQPFKKHAYDIAKGQWITVK